MSMSKTLYRLLSTSSTKKTHHDMTEKIVDWDERPPPPKKNAFKINVSIKNTTFIAHICLSCNAEGVIHFMNAE